MRLIQTFLNFIFPERCLSCRFPGTLLCQTCIDSLPIHDRQFCPNCLIESPMGSLCAHCRLSWPLDSLFVMAPYSQKSLLQKAIQMMKYHHALSVAESLGNWMVPHYKTPFDQFFNFDSQNVYIVPVPLHPLRQKMRGYNQAQILANAISSTLGLPLLQPIERTRNTPPQAQLTRNDRLNNLSNSFALRGNHDLLNKKIILIDDVCSTGATLNHCAEILKQGGASQIHGLILARG